MIIVFTGCNKCKENQTGYYSFTPEELKINPYHSQDSVLLKNQSGDSLQLVVSSRKDYMEKNHKYATEECSGDYAMVELNETTLTSKDGTWEFSIDLNFIPAYPADSYDKILTFTAMYLPNQSNYSLSGSSVHFEQDTIYNVVYESPDSLLRFFENLNLGPKTFHNVYEIGLSYFMAHTDEWATTLYYSIDEGILGFKTRQNTIWYLD